MDIALSELPRGAYEVMPGGDTASLPALVRQNRATPGAGVDLNQEKYSSQRGRSLADCSRQMQKTPINPAMPQGERGDAIPPGYGFG